MRAAAFSIALVAALCAIAGNASAEEPVAFTVIAHAGVKPPPLARSDVRALFAKRVTRWADDVLVVPLDLAPTSPVRAAFSVAVHGKSPHAVLSEWRQRIFTGQGMPPRELRDEAAMVAAVAATPGAIGYVKAGTPLPPQVRVITLTD